MVVSGGRSAAKSSRVPGAHLGFRGPRGHGDLSGPCGPWGFLPLWAPGTSGLGGPGGAEDHVRSGPGSGSRAVPEWKGLALRTEAVEGSSPWCVDCWGSHTLVLRGLSRCGVRAGSPVLPGGLEQYRLERLI
ncbi:hypothetical protein NDU88_006564 [Pleurodeles waltl]|uniref:Uncharacterized protein n=1 Tax=Pleurodeles waltl TaxID=8319 RepID=A0AAV7LSB0_PLEWA|nr:hypothetical protein NDU88_006564 [Pleurodeles waltl]